MVSTKKYTIEDVLDMIFIKGLSPEEARRACMEPCSRQTLHWRLVKAKEKYREASLSKIRSNKVIGTNVTVRNDLLSPQSTRWNSLSSLSDGGTSQGRRESSESSTHGISERHNNVGNNKVSSLQSQRKEQDNNQVSSQGSICISSMPPTTTDSITNTNKNKNTTTITYWDKQCQLMNLECEDIVGKEVGGKKGEKSSTTRLSLKRRTMEQAHAMQCDKKYKKL